MQEEFASFSRPLNGRTRTATFTDSTFDIAAEHWAQGEEDYSETSPAQRRGACLHLVSGSVITLPTHNQEPLYERGCLLHFGAANIAPPAALTESSVHPSRWKSSQRSALTFLLARGRGGGLS